MKLVVSLWLLLVLTQLLLSVLFTKVEILEKQVDALASRPAAWSTVP